MTCADWKRQKEMNKDEVIEKIGNKMKCNSCKGKLDNDTEREDLGIE